MANETEYSNFTTVAAYVAAASAPAFVANSVMQGLITVEQPTPGSNAKKFNAEGSLSATVTAESAAATKAEYTETSVTVTMAKATVYSDVTHEAQQWSGSNRLAQLAAEAGRAQARKFDIDSMALFDGFSQSTGSTGVDVTVAVLRQALYTIDLGNARGSAKFVLHPTALFDVGTNLVGLTGSVWGNSGFDPSLVTGAGGSVGQGNGFKGFFMNAPVYVSTLTESINAGADWSCACFTELALASLLMPLDTMVSVDAPSALTQLNVIMSYGVAEWKDTAGVLILADQ